MEATVLDLLPEPAILKKQLKIQAALNTIVCQEDWLRYHSFDQDWAEDVSMAKIDNGAGDRMYILFSPDGCILKGFDHESELSPYAQDEHRVFDGIYDDVPAQLLSLLDDDAMEKDVVTFCIWRESSESNWRKGKVAITEGESDGSQFLVGCIFQTPEDFVEFAEGYFELSLPLDIVVKIYDGASITGDMIKALNPDRDVKEVLYELKSLNLSD
ncbi:hypothetical protein [Cohnella hashimotonis]|uniref:SMI1/KNR4 family protein n=1 Tax=Cohnella hashimotonis TaxID=2826895 RepID=A0ABT6THS3_9BACL|nr:hypothetical protein [Cohnella hashimotonis]MDI4645865.1 hypothetical protein [Cohnella hashimotonis]